MKWYFGSSNDLRLNLRVQRLTASPSALAALAPYETTGTLALPLVTLHTTRDDVVPLLYLGKADLLARDASCRFRHSGTGTATSRPLKLRALFFSPYRSPDVGASG